MARTLTEIDSRLAHLLDQARRLPSWHPDYAELHAHIDELCEERAALEPLRPSQVLATDRA